MGSGRRPWPRRPWLRRWFGMLKRARRPQHRPHVTRMISEERRQRGARMTRVRAAAAARTPTQRDADKRLFLSAVKDPLEREDFGRFGWGSALNATAIFAFWEDLQPGLFDGVQAGHAVVAKGMDFAHRDALGPRRPRLMFGPVKATQP